MQLGKDVAAIVTGGASGLGAASARALAAKGVKVGVLDLNEAQGAALANAPSPLSRGAVMWWASPDMP